jgi:hypothetical protein
VAKQPVPVSEAAGYHEGHVPQLRRSFARTHNSKKRDVLKVNRCTKGRVYARRLNCGRESRVCCVRTFVPDWDCQRIFGFVPSDGYFLNSSLLD